MAWLLKEERAPRIPRPGGKLAAITSLSPLADTGAFQAEGVADLGGKRPASPSLSDPDVQGAVDKDG